MLTTNRAAVKDANASEVITAVVGSSRSVTARINPKTLLMLADLIVVVLAVLATAAVLQLFDGPEPVTRDRLVVITMLTLPVWPAVLTHQRLYNTRFIGRRIDEARRIFNAVALGVWASPWAATCSTWWWRGPPWHSSSPPPSS